MRERSCIDCVSLVFLVRRLFLVWMLATSFFRVYWPLFPCWVVCFVLWWPEPALDVGWCPLCSLLVTALSGGRVCSLAVGVEDPRSSSKLWYAVGGTGVLPLEKEPLRVLPQELSASMCYSVTLPATWCALPQSSLLLALPSEAASTAGAPVVGSDFSPTSLCAWPQNLQNPQRLEPCPTVSTLMMRLLQWDPCPSLPVLTVGFRWQAHVLSACTPICGPRPHSGPFGLCPCSQTESSPWVCLLSPSFSTQCCTRQQLCLRLGSAATWQGPSVLVSLYPAGLQASSCILL